MIIAPSNNGILTPSDTQPQIWLDPRNYDGNNTRSSNGTALSSIKNLGAIGSTFAQASGGAQPTIQNNVVNTNPVFRFSGAQSMTMSSFAGLNYAGPMSVFVVFNTPNANPGIAQRFLAYPAGWAFLNSGNNLQFTMFGAGAYDLFGFLITNDTWFNSAAVYDGSNNCDFYLNGTKYNVADSITMSLQTTNLFFGSRDGTQGFVTGDIALVLVYFRALAAWEINGINFYLKNRFNL